MRGTENFNEYFSNIALKLDIQRPPIATFHYEEVLNKIKKLKTTQAY